MTEGVQPGSIILFHNAALHTPEALPGILEYLLGEGYQVVPVGQLILPGTCGTDYTIDHTVRQMPAEHTLRWQTPLNKSSPHDTIGYRVRA